MAGFPKYSILMSVYYKENHKYFETAIESMLGQTIAPSQFVLVCDGALGGKLDKVVSKYEKAYPQLFCVVRLPENKGLANALNEGLKYCTNDYIARMDSDDISLPDRMKLQLSAMQKHCAVICSGTIEEFIDNPENVVATKACPRSNDDILAYARRRNPFNHPCVTYKRQAVLDAGGYEKYPFFEDYQLWLKMLFAKAKGYNVMQTLLKMRTGNGMYARRGGFKYFEYAKKLEVFKLKIGFSTRTDYVICIITKLVFSLVPSKVRELLYKLLLR